MRYLVLSDFEGKEAPQGWLKWNTAFMAFVIYLGVMIFFAPK